MNLLELELLFNIGCAADAALKREEPGIKEHTGTTILTPAMLSVCEAVFKLGYNARLVDANAAGQVPLDLLAVKTGPTT